MIRIYDKEERLFNHLGLGSLDEAIAAVVVEELKTGGYELEMEYPINGRHFDKIKHRNIIFCKPNMYSTEQPFRIYAISKPFKGIVTINAEHISYDASGVTILPKRNEDNEIESYGTKVTVDDKDGYYLDTILAEINNSAAIQGKNYFVLSRDPLKANEFKEEGYSIPLPMNLRSMLGGSENSIVDIFKGEYLFDKYNIILKDKRGTDRGITIRYGKNMTDLEQEVEGTNLFTGIFPFYSKSYTETFTTTTPVFQEAFIIKDVTPLRADWLSIELVDVSKGIGGISLKPVVEVMKIIVDGAESLVERYAPIKVKTPNDPLTPQFDFYDKVYVFKRNTEDLGNLINSYVTQTTIINEKEVITELKLNPEDLNPIVPEFGIIYNILGETSPFFNRKFIYDKNSYVEYSSDGFYVEAKDATLVSESTPLPTIIPTYPISWDPDTSAWIRDDQNGSIYVRPLKPNVGTKSVDKYVYEDLLDYVLDPESEALLENGILYVNQELKDLSSQKILTLDLTSDLDDIPNLQPTDITKEHIFDKAEQYLKDNDLTKLKESITISFIKLSDSPEYEHFKDLEVVELGDEVSVIYEDLGINSKHRVISTEYNVLTNSYNEIELGDVLEKITNNVISRGDNISALKNDSDFAEKTYVVDFVAENADIINAQIQNAIIKTLEAAHVNISNSLTASYGTIDQLVASMLIAEDAKISNMLEAGSVRVTGKIVALSGEIGGCVIDEEGHLIVPSANITGTLAIGQLPDDVAVTTDIPTALSQLANDSGFKDETGVTTIIEGVVTTDYINARGISVAAANITGTLAIGQLPEEVAVTDDIPTVPTKVSDLWNDSGFQNATGVTTIINGTITTDYINARLLTVAAAKVTGKLSAVNIEIGSGNFIVDENGNVSAQSFALNTSGAGGSVNINGGKLTAENADIAGNITSDEIHVDEIVIKDVIRMKLSTLTTATTTDYTVSTTNPLVNPTGSDYLISVSAKVNNVLLTSKEISVYIRYAKATDWDGALEFVNDVIQITINPANGTNWVSGSKTVYAPYGLGAVTTTGHFPMSFSQTTSGQTTPGMFINGDVIPNNPVPTTTAVFNLGASTRRWDNIYLANQPNVSSDIRLKKEVNYDISAYDLLFDNLKPAAYKLIAGTSDRIHIGFIAQDLKQALIDAGIDSKDFAGYVRALNPESREKAPEELTEDDYNYGIRYAELQALQVRQIQLLKEQIKLLEARIATLEDKDEGSS